ncbi:polyketide synthase PksJ [Mycobacteroides abscessus subsp. abscessus]|nr:polyketide synthase PksJ [Mycobacteroides abscessus subsp. abscessus]
MDQPTRPTRGGRSVNSARRCLKQVDRFRIGGNSVLLALAQRLVQEEFGCQIALVDLFRYPTVSSLAVYLSSREFASDPSDPEPVAVADAGVGSGRARIRQEARRRRRAR